MDGDLGLLITAACDAADDARQHRDYRGKQIHVGRGLIYAISALAQAIDHFATVVTPPEENP